MAFRGQIFLLAVITAASGAASARAQSNSPCLAVDCPTYDFGSALNTGQVAHVFVLRNTGSAKLDISKVQTSCGCATTKLGTNSIPPGAETELATALDLRGRSGPQRKSIYVHSNDPLKPIFQLQITGDAVAATNVSGTAPALQLRIIGGTTKPSIGTTISQGAAGKMTPARLDFGRISDAATNAAEIMIIGEGKTPVRLLEASSSNTLLLVQTSCAETGRQYHISVRLRRPLIPGKGEGAVRIRTSSPATNEVLVPVSWQVHSDIYAMPGEFVLVASGVSTNPVTRYAAIRSRSGKPFKILKTAPPEPGIAVNCAPMSSGGYRLSVSNIQPRAELSGEEITITTDVTTGQPLIIPFRVIPAAEPSQKE